MKPFPKKPLTEEVPLARDPRVMVTGTRDSWMVARMAADMLILEIHQPAGEGLPDFTSSIVLGGWSMANLTQGLVKLAEKTYPPEELHAYFIGLQESPYEPVAGDTHNALPTEAGDNPESERTPAIPDPWATPTP